jgi:hypothetical protein
MRVLFMRVGVGALLLAALLCAGMAAAQSAQESSSRKHAAGPVAEEPGVRDGIYHNPDFGFTYKLPYGWVDRTAEMQPDANDPSSGQVLLAFFERPPEAESADLNSAIVIASEPVSAYHSLKTAADYFGPLDEITTAKGFQAEGDPYEFPVGAKKLARGDFTKSKGTQTLRQTSLVMLEKGQIVSFTFIAASEDDMNDLVERLSFPERHRR